MVTVAGMFRPTSPQRPLFGAESRVDRAKRKRLEKTWAHAYRTSALPLIDESRFAKYFDDDNGRPNKSVRLVVSVLVLKEVFDETDQEALDDLEWNLTWHYALDVTPEEAHTCQKTLHNFRTRLLADDEGAGLFESTTARLIEAAGVHTRRQRLDSTHVVSNIRLLTRLGLFVQTITKFLKELRRDHPRLAADVLDELCERYLDREGYFGDVRRSEAPRRLEQSALDLYYLVSRFEGSRSVKAMPSYTLLKRLYEEQCVPPASDTPERIELQERPSAASLQSPSDPDVTYGYKGKGYEVQLAETCEEESPIQVVTAVSVGAANESDQQHLQPTLEQVERTSGGAPTVVHTDSGYASGENLVAAQDKGTNLAAPIGQPASTKTVHLPVLRFEFDERGERVIKCPAGHAPARHVERRTGIFADFAMRHCRRCPLRDECPTVKRIGRRVLHFTRGEVAVARRRVEQQTPEFKERHKIRSGIEATNSELKRRHGFRKLRVRGRARVALAVRLKALAVNIKRYVAYLVAPKPQAAAEAAA
jgi:IS5 family transposase